MGPVSQNGYSANDRSKVSSRTIPDTSRKVTVRNGPAGDLLLWVAGQFDNLVEKIDAGQLDDWGYAERPIRGGTELSNHASGTAIDLNATRHPLGTQPSANFSRKQIDAIHAIVGRTQGCVRWGGDYTGRKDGMHFEIVRGEAACAAALAALTATKPAPQPVTEEDELDAEEKRMLREIHAAYRVGIAKRQSAGQVMLLIREAALNTRKMAGELVGIQNAQEQLAKSGKVDLAAVTAAAQKGAEAGATAAVDRAMEELQATVEREVDAS